MRIMIDVRCSRCTGLRDKLTTDALREFTTDAGVLGSAGVSVLGGQELVAVILEVEKSILLTNETISKMRLTLKR